MREDYPLETGFNNINFVVCKRFILKPAVLIDETTCICKCIADQGAFIQFWGSFNMFCYANIIWCFATPFSFSNVTWRFPRAGQCLPISLCMYRRGNWSLS